MEWIRELVRAWGIIIVVGIVGVGLLVYGVWEEIKPREVVNEEVILSGRVSWSEDGRERFEGGFDWENGDVVVVKGHRAGVDQIKFGFGVIFAKTGEGTGPTRRKTGPKFDFESKKAIFPIGDKIDLLATDGAKKGKLISKMKIVVGGD